MLLPSGGKVRVPEAQGDARIASRKGCRATRLLDLQNERDILQERLDGVLGECTVLQKANTLQHQPDNTLVDKQVLVVGRWPVDLQARTSRRSSEHRMLCPDSIAGCILSFQCSREDSFALC